MIGTGGSGPYLEDGVRGCHVGVTGVSAELRRGGGRGKRGWYIHVVILASSAMQGERHLRGEAALSDAGSRCAAVRRDWQIGQVLRAAGFIPFSIDNTLKHL